MNFCFAFPFLKPVGVFLCGYKFVTVCPIILIWFHISFHKMGLRSLFRMSYLTDPVFCCFQVNTWTGSCAGMPSFPCLCCVRCPAPKTVCSVPGHPGLCVPTPAQGRTQRASRPEHAPFWPTMQGTVRVLYTVSTKMEQILV